MFGIDIWSWVRGAVDYLLPFFAKKKATLILVGLDAAGKTTLMRRLKDDHLTQPLPTWMPYAETLQCGNVTFTTYDLGGHKQVRRVWKTYLPAADGLVFILDGADFERFQEASAELEHLLAEELISDLPIAILINKIDIQGAANVEYVAHSFKLKNALTGEDKGSDLQGRRPLQIFPCSVKMRQGYGTALKWLAQHM